MAPSAPAVRVRVRVTDPPFSFAVYAAGSNCTVPGCGTGAVSSSVMVTVALAGAPNVAPPVGADRVTVNVSALSTAASFAIATLHVLLAASPSAHDTIEAPLV